MYVPQGDSALAWTDKGEIFSAEEADMQLAMFGSPEDAVDELYDALIAKARERMCDADARPDTLTVRVNGGASMFVHASAELEATFSYSSLCGEEP